MGSERAASDSRKEAVKSLEVAKELWAAKADPETLSENLTRTGTYYANSAGNTVCYAAADLGYKG